MKRRIGVVLGICLSLTLLGVSSVSSAAPQIVGTKCVKAGSFRTAKNVRYQCKKSAKGLRWVTISTKSVSTTTSTTTTTIPSISKDPVVASTQQLIDALDISTSRNATSVVMHVESGSNGDWPTFMAGALKYSLDFYSALGFTFTQPRIDFVLGRTQVWSKSKIGELFPGCWPDDKRFEGGYSLCAYPDRGGIGVNLVNNVLPWTGLINPDASVAGLKRDQVWKTPAHEAWHNWQDGIGYTKGVRDDPTWWKEGGAVYFSTIAWAKFLNKSRSIDTLWFWEVEPGEYTRFSAGDCSMRISNLNNVCSYSKGALVVQYFVHRFGVDAYRSLYSTWQTNLTFSANFQRVTGMSLDQFYVLSEDWLASRDWQSK